MKKHCHLNGNIIKHDHKYMYPNADQIQLQKRTVTLILGQLSKGCFINDGVSTKRTPITIPTTALAIATLYTTGIQMHIAKHSLKNSMELSNKFPK